ncbi:MAG: mismatch repair endonuclease MutL [Bacteroidota bacterium]
MNIIHHLPPNIANQIAAGEVIQRPASAVKELLENAVDAGATEIQLVVVDAGKSLLQVIDNGRGMSEVDARNCFGRHATSKIKAIDDLFHVRTMGFRGEALASVAAVSQVLLRTKREEDELGTEVEIENSHVLRQDPCQSPTGTSISMKNLFFNVPARRNFLKADAVEMKHITEEFMRVALSFPQVHFSLHSNGKELFHLDAGTLKQRIVQLMGSSYASKLVQVNEKTDYLTINGFIGKPETAKKTRGDQFLFVNNRFIRNPYLNHAVVSAFEEMIPSGCFPFFVLFLDMDPSQVDVNVHPTKQEIKFTDEKIVYAFVRSAIRHALAQFSVAPSMDFGLDASIQQLDAVSKPFTADKQQEATAGSLYKSFVDRHQAHRIETGSNLRNWKDFFDPTSSSSTSGSSEVGGSFNFAEPAMQSAQPSPSASVYKPSSSAQPLPGAVVFQQNLTYIVTASDQSVLIYHQQLLHQQVLFEKFKATWEGKAIPVQQSMFPQAIQLSPADAQLLQGILPDLLQMGYQLEPFGSNAFLLQGSPADHVSENDAAVIEMILEDVKDIGSTLHRSYKERMAKTLARKHAIKAGKTLTVEEMRDLLERISCCENPVMHFDGKPLLVEVKGSFLSDTFQV